MIYPKSLGRKAYQSVSEYKPTEEDLICLNCSKSDCKKGICKRFNEELRKIRRG